MSEKDHKKRDTILVIAVLIISIILIVFRPHFQTTTFSDSDAKTTEGKVLEIISEKDKNEKDIAYIGITKIQKLLVNITENKKSKNVEVENNFSPVNKGDRILLQSIGENSYEIIEFSRTRGILLLTLVFVVLVLLIGGKKGFNALVGLVYSFAIILYFIIPRILGGMNPILVSLIGSVLILTVTLYVSYGLNRKSLSAFIGISLTLLFVGILAQYAVHALHFTGLGSEESSFLLQEMADKIDFVSLIIGGIIIAAIGVLDDVAITQASTVFALHSVDSRIKHWELYKKAMEVGKDHSSAVINTLVLAYTGAALPLVLLLSMGTDTNSANIMSIEIVAEEIVRTLISTSGLILAVPITTMVAVFFAKRRVV